jgi:hypothetical protein
MNSGSKVKSHKKRKRSFLLLEVLIATFIASFCLYLVFQPHVSCLKEEMKLAKKLDFERLADSSFLEVYQKILEEGSSFFLEPSKPFNEPTYYYWGYKKVSIERSYEVKAIKGSIDDEGFLAKIDIILDFKGDQLSYAYNVFLKGNKVLL